MAVKRCGAKKRGGGKCGQAAGLGTDHLGSGRCKWHGGASPSGRKAAAKDAALTFARGALGAEVDGSAIDLMEDAGRLSRGLLVYYRHEIAAAATKRPPNLVRIEELRPQFEAAIKLAKDVAGAALTAGVAERRQRLAERQAELVVAAVGDALRESFGDLATPERLTVFSDVLRTRLLVLEAQADETGPLGLPSAA